MPVVVDNALDYSTIDLDLLRTYTVRGHDPEAGEVTIDFVVHQGGLASRWAQGARPGDVVGLNTPTGMYDAPAGLAWQILVSDCAGLPASSYKAVGYWIEDAEAWQARYDALDESTREAPEALWDSDRPEEEIEDDYDERLAQLGL